MPSISEEKERRKKVLKMGSKSLGYRRTSLQVQADGMVSSELKVDDAIDAIISETSTLFLSYLTPLELKQMRERKEQIKHNDFGKYGRFVFFSTIRFIYLYRSHGSKCANDGSTYRN